MLATHNFLGVSGGMFAGFPNTGSGTAIFGELPDCVRPILADLAALALILANFAISGAILGFPARIGPLEFPAGFCRIWLSQSPSSKFCSFRQKRQICNFWSSLWDFPFRV